MICRIWRGWTTPENADAYQRIVLGQVIPGIEAMRISGFRQIDLLRAAHADEVEFTTLMWFDSLDFRARLHGRRLFGEPCPGGGARRPQALRRARRASRGPGSPLAVARS